MASSVSSNAARRPLPALISLVALIVLMAIVWWRVINRDSGTTHVAAKQCATASASPTASATPAATPTVTLPQPASVDVLVLNSTTTTGLAGRARTALLKVGFTSKQAAGNFEGPGTITGVGEIRFPASQRAAATLLGYYLPGATLVAEKAASPVTVVLGPGFRSIRSSAEVQAALAAAQAAVSPAPATTSSASAGC